jgi:hypothetical protein
MFRHFHRLEDADDLEFGKSWFAHCVLLFLPIIGETL